MTLALVKEGSPATDAEEALDRVFFALSDPVRRAILRRLDEGPALVSELAAPFEMSLQAVSLAIAPGQVVGALIVVGAVIGVGMRKKEGKYP